MRAICALFSLFLLAAFCFHLAFSGDFPMPKSFAVSIGDPSIPGTSTNPPGLIKIRENARGRPAYLSKLKSQLDKAVGHGTKVNSFDVEKYKYKVDWLREVERRLRPETFDENASRLDYEADSEGSRSLSFGFLQADVDRIKGWIDRTFEIEHAEF